MKNELRPWRDPCRLVDREVDACVVAAAVMAAMSVVGRPMLLSLIFSIVVTT